MDPTTSGVDPGIFEDLQTNIDDDARVRDEIRAILQRLDRQHRGVLAVLSRAHYTPQAELSPTLEAAMAGLVAALAIVDELATAASSHPYYKYNGLWTHDVQTAAFAVLLCAWLRDDGRLLTLDEVGEAMNIPVNLKDRDAFHLTTEEYLQALVSLIEELSRLAMNSVTLGDYQRPLQISRFVKDLHAGFQILNLKNDALRRRSDTIKYHLKKVEDVVYDISLRNLVPRDTPSS